MSFISFSCLITLARTFNILLNIGGKHFYLIPHLEDMLKLFTTEYNVSCGFFINGLYYGEICSFYSNYGESFYHEWMLNFV